jgi:hypothetical protein
MAGTAVAWRTTNIAQNAGQLWGLLAIPAAAARITLFSDGTPDATANPSAFHYGATKAGAKLMIKSTFAKYPVDEFRAPIVTNLDTIEMGISAELVGTTDMNVIANLLPGVGTYSTAGGYKQVSIGGIAIVYQSVAHIFPLIEDTTKWGVFNVYSALNDTGVEWSVGRKELGFTPCSFTGYEITTRAVTDTLGNYWKQIA